MASTYIEIMGWSGGILIFLAYIMIVTGKLKITSKIYLSSNMIGASFIGFNSFVNKAHPSAVFNTLWLVIAAYGFSRLKKNKIPWPCRFKQFTHRKNHH